jgi:sugar lactone lactonase YvrE
MSTRRGGERATKTDERPAAAPAAGGASTDTKAATIPSGKPAGSGGAAASVSAAPAAAAAAAPAPPPKPFKRMRPEADDGGWGEPAPDPVKHVPQPLLPVIMIAGTGDAGFRDGPCKYANFRGPAGIAISAEGSLFIADADNRRLRKVSQRAPPADDAGDVSGTASAPSFDMVTTIAGSGQPGYRDGKALGATLWDPSGVAVDPEGNVYVSDAGSHTIRRVGVAGELTVIAGTGKPGYRDGKGTQAAFEYPYGIAFGTDGTLFVADSGNHRIRTISPAGDVKTLAGNGTPGFRDGSANSAMFNSPVGIAVDSEGTIFVSDRANHRVRRLTAKGTVSTLAGSGKSGVVDGKGQAASFAWPNAIAVDPSARGAVYVSDTFSFRVRRVARDGQVRTVCVGAIPPTPPPAPAPSAAAPELAASSTAGSAAGAAAPATAAEAAPEAAPAPAPETTPETAPASAPAPAAEEVPAAGDAADETAEPAAKVAKTEEASSAKDAPVDATAEGSGTLAAASSEAAAEGAEGGASAMEVDETTSAAAPKQEEAAAAKAEEGSAATSEAVPTAPATSDAAPTAAATATAAAPAPVSVVPSPAPAPAHIQPPEDENRCNTLLFFALDAQRSLLYVTEPANNRVRCVALDADTVSTTGP